MKSAPVSSATSENLKHRRRRQKYMMIFSWVKKKNPSQHLKNLTETRHLLNNGSTCIDVCADLSRWILKSTETNWLDSTKCYKTTLQMVMTRSTLQKKLLKVNSLTAKLLTWSQPNSSVTEDWTEGGCSKDPAEHLKGANSIWWWVVDFRQWMNFHPSIKNNYWLTSESLKMGERV